MTKNRPHSHLSAVKLPAGNFWKFHLETPSEVAFDAGERGTANG